MANDAVRSYQNAAQSLEWAKKKMEKHVEAIQKAAEKLKGWRAIRFSANVRAGDIPENGFGESGIFEPGELPSFNELATDSSDYQDALRAADRAWNGIPGGDRFALEEPKAFR